MRALLVGVDRVVGRLRAEVCVARAQLRGRRRRRTARRPRAETCGLRLDAIRDRRALLDVRHEGRRDGGDQDRAGERRSERGAEVGHRVLDAADLRALVVGHGGDGDGAELRGERADPEPDEEHRHEDDLRPGVRRRAGRAGRRCRQAARRARTRTTRRGETSREETRDADGGGQERDREREQSSAGRKRGEARGRPTGTAARRRRGPPARGTGRRTSIRPPSSWRFRSIAGRTSGSSPGRLEPGLPAEEEPDDEQPCERSARPSARGPPRTCRRASAGSSPTHWSEERRRRAGRARAPTGTEPTTSRRGR